MKGRMTERLSRLIDGELDSAESEELQAILKSDRALRRELDGLNRVRQSLRSLAERERPPAELDTLVDPLLRGKPESALARPWARWMAAAAVVVLGVTVMLEVQRRQPDSALGNWQERALDGTVAEPTRGFSLAPLPTSSVPDERPRGAADRLVAAPEPEVNPAPEPAPALEVMGPLSNGSVSEQKRDSGRRIDLTNGQPPTRLEAGEQSAAGRPNTRESEASAKSAGNMVPSDPDRSKSTTDTRDSGTGTEDSGVTASGAQLFVFMESETAWRGFAPDGPCEAGRYALRIRVEDGVIREVWPVANPPAPTRQVRASQLVLGLEVENVADGEYSAEVVIEPRHPPNR